MAVKKTKLNFIKKSNDNHNSTIVIFQKNVAESFDETAVAWTVIKNPKQLIKYSFLYPSHFKVQASDPDGNPTCTMTACEGQSFELAAEKSENCLKLSSIPAINKKDVEIKNSLETGAISGYALRDEKILAAKSGIAPGQKAVFQFPPTIWVGAVSQVEEGDVMKSAVIQSINKELPIENLSSADIVMTGGGPGAASTPVTFNLENQKK